MEIIKKTLPVGEATGWHTLQTEFKRWIEDVADEDTGNVVSVERSEVILSKGCQLTALDVSTLIENGIDSVFVSNIPLKGVKEEYANLWEASIRIKIRGSYKKKTYIVTAESPAGAEKFISEYLEVNVECSFEAIKVLKLDYNMVVKLYETEREQYERDGLRHVRWYKAQIFSAVDGGEVDGGDMRNVLVQGTSFESAFNAIKAVMGRNEYDAVYSFFKSIQELNIEEVFIPDEKVMYYSNEEL